MQHLNKYYPFDADNYVEFFDTEYSIKMGTDYEESCRVFDAITLLPKQMVKDLIDAIEIDSSLGKPKKEYPNHGRWDNDSKTMYLNPLVLKHEHEESRHLILHEIGHAMDSKLDNISLNKSWRSLSGWTQNPPGISNTEKSDDDYLEHGNYRRLKIEEDDMLIVSNWWHLESAKFVREYASRNPKEDLAESFSYYVLGDMKKFKDCSIKAAFVRDNMIGTKD